MLLSTSKTFEFNIENMLEIDVLNCSSFILAKTLSDMLVSHTPNSSITKNNKRAMLYDNFYILSHAYEELTFEHILDYFGLEKSFVYTNLKALSKEDEQQDSYLLTACHNIIPLPYEDYVYLLEDELVLLPEIAYALKSSTNSKSLMNIIINYERLSFSTEMINKYKLTTLLFIRFWMNFILNSPVNQSYALLDLSNIADSRDKYDVEEILSELPEEIKVQIIY